MKYRLKKKLGDWAAGTTKTREEWNDAGLPMQLLGDPNWFEKVTSPEKARITIWAGVGGQATEYCFFDAAPIYEDSEPIRLTDKQKAAVEAALNGEAPDGWTVDQLRDAAKAYVSSQPDDIEYTPIEIIDWFLDHLETLKPEQDGNTRAFTHEEVTQRLKAFAAWWCQYGFQFIDPVSTWLHNSGPAGEYPIDGKHLPPPSKRRIGEPLTHEHAGPSPSDADMIAFGRVCITEWTTNPGAARSVNKLFRDFKNREPARLFTLEEMEDVARKASWDFCESGTGGDGAEIVAQWLKDNNT